MACHLRRAGFSQKTVLKGSFKAARYNTTNLHNTYAHIEIVGDFLVLKIVSVLVITWQGVGVQRPYQDTTFLSSPRTSLYLLGT